MWSVTFGVSVASALSQPGQPRFGEQFPLPPDTLFGRLVEQ
jgi:hypothetical protein